MAMMDCARTLVIIIKQTLETNILIELHLQKKIVSFGVSKQRRVSSQARPACCIALF